MISLRFKTAQKKLYRGFIFNGKGFTLIELLIIIAILGILSVAVLVAVNPTKRRNQAKDAIVKNDIATIATVMEAYFVLKGGYPHGGTAIAELVALRELKNHIYPPPGGPSIYYVYTNPNDCTSNGPIFCTSMSVFYPLFDPAVAENYWCYRSSLGKASEVTYSAGCPAT